MMKIARAGLWLSAVSLALALCVGTLAQSATTHDPGSQVALQALLNQGFEVKAASTGEQGVQTLYLQKAAMLFACPLQVVGLACSRIVSK
jgi:CBS-domain-containing membrane protein